MNRPVVITGMGAITPIGLNILEIWEAVGNGASGIAPLSAYDHTKQAVRLAAEVKADLSSLLTAAELRKNDRFTQFALIAAREAIADAGLSGDNFNLDRVDTLVSSGIGGMSTTIREYNRGLDKGFDRISPLYIPMTIANIAAGRIAIEHGLRGDCACVVTACASSTHALGEAMRHIRHGYADAVLCGGAEATIIPLAMGGFTSMQALHRGDNPNRASIPFDAERSGFVMGEGAGMLLLEAQEHAEARGAHVYAEVAGFGASCDAYHITAPEPEGQGALRAMQRALLDANLSAKEIGYVNAHGTSTALNDACEALAIHKLFASANSTPPPVSSSKSMTGHMLGAAGAVEAIITALALQHSFLPPTVNYRVYDPQCDLDVVPGKGRPANTLQAAFSNSLGFGGHNATLVLRRSK